MSDVPDTASILSRLARAETLLSDVDLSSIEASSLPQITASLRRVESRCSALGVAIAVVAKTSGDDPSATLLGTGKVSGRQARQEAKRADVVQRMPDLGAALHPSAATSATA